MKLDFESEIPIYIQIAEALEILIVIEDGGKACLTKPTALGKGTSVIVSGRQ